jgi:hypothetical protein
LNSKILETLSRFAAIPNDPLMMDLSIGHSNFCWGCLSPKSKTLQERTS